MERLSDKALANIADLEGYPSVRDRLATQTQEEATAYIVGLAPLYPDRLGRYFQDYLELLHGPAVRRYRYYN